MIPSIHAPVSANERKAKLHLFVSILTIIVLLVEPSKIADAQLCGPPYTPPFEGIPFQDVIVILALVIGLLIVVGIFIRRRQNRGIAGAAVFGIAMLAVSFVSTPIITHIELVNELIEEEDAMHASNNGNVIPCYDGEYLCPIINVTNNEINSSSIFSSNPKLISLLNQPEENYPHHILVNYYDRWELENTIKSVAATQFSHASDAVFRQPGTPYDSFILQYNNNYYRIFFTPIIPAHYVGLKPFTYYTSEVILWIAAITLFYYLIIWKQPAVPSVSPAARTKEQEMKMTYVFDRIRISSPNLIKWVACGFLANHSIRIALIITIASASFIFVTGFSIGYEAAVLAIDMLMIFIVYFSGVAIPRYLCHQKT